MDQHATGTKRNAIRKGWTRIAKVRTGCITCKIRRVKCDETKPTCQRCAYGLRECTWPASKSSIVSMKETSGSCMKPLLPHAPCPAPIMPDPSFNLFANDQEQWYFHMYTRETFKDLSGAFRSVFWNRIVLQTAHHHPSVRSAIIAIAGLANRAKSPTARISGLTDIDGGSISEEQFALVHYYRFLRGTRKELEGGNPNTRLALISCLLVTCIENLQWHHQGAMKTMWRGLKIFEEWLRDETSGGIEIDSGLSPRPGKIEDDIIEQIKMYDSQTSWLFDPTPPNDHQRLRFQGQRVIDSMTTSFRALDEAKSLFEILDRRIHHFIASIRPRKYEMPDAPDANKHSLHIIFDNEASIGPLTPEQVETQLSYLAEIRRFERCFLKLHENTDVNSQDFIGVNLLKIRSRLLPVMLFGFLSSTEMIYDAYTDNFQDIIHYTRVHFAHESVVNMPSKGVYSLNTGLSRPLFITASSCRVRHIRREAIDILMYKPWREGIMVSFTTGLAARFIMQVEEEGLTPDETVPESSRALTFDMKMRQEDVKRTIQQRAFRGTEELLNQTWEWTVQDTPCSNNGLQVNGLSLRKAVEDRETGRELQNKLTASQVVDPAEMEQPGNRRPNGIPFRASR